MTHPLRQIDPPDDRMVALVDAYLAESASPDELAELDAAIESDAQVAAYVTTALDLHATLRWSRRGPVAMPWADTPAPGNPLSAAGVPIYRKGCEPQPFRLRAHHYALAAAVLVSAAVVAVFVFVLGSQPVAPDPPAFVPVATLIETDTTVVVNNGIGNPGDDYAAGRYSIESGSAQFMLTNRVTVDMRGKTRLTMYGNMRASLARGNATFKCPPGTEGYTVDLPGGSRVVDLGTEFEIDVDDDGRSVVWVREGVVRLERIATIAADAPPITLTVDRVARLASNDSVATDPAVATGRRVLITPSAITQAAGDTHAGFDAVDLISDVGLEAAPVLRDLGQLRSPVDNTDTASGMWVTARSHQPNYFRHPKNPQSRFVVRFDRSYEMSALVVWGYGGNTNEASDFVVEFSTDGGVTWSQDTQTVATDRLLGRAAANLRFDRIRSADAVRLTITNNANGRGFPGVGGDRIGLGAIRFIGDRMDQPEGEAEADDNAIENSRNKDAAEELNPGPGR